MRNLLALVLPLLAASAALAEQQQQDQKSDLICPEGQGCYPRIFEPTHEFQVIKPDQEIPPGLHIRMNFETGVKEAKLYAPSPDEANDPNNAVVVVDEDANIVASEEQPVAEVHAPEENIRPPKEELVAPGTFTSWTKTLKDVKATEKELLDALEGLEELAHEIYWGKQLSKPEIFPELLQLAVAPQSTTKVRAAAALVLGSTCGNNPAALKSGVESVGGLENFIGPLLATLQKEEDEVVRTRLVWVLSQAVADTAVRKKFVEMGGVGVMEEEFVKEGGENVKGKVAVLVEDTFLNEDMRKEGDEVMGSTDGRALGPFCGRFQEAILGGLGDTSEERVLSALVALKKVLTSCQASSQFEDWMKTKAGNEGIADLKKEAKSLFSARTEL